MPKVKRQYVSRGGRKSEIWDKLNALDRSLTTYEIARLCHLEPSTYLRKILQEMVEENTVAFFEVQHRPNSVKRLYVVHDKYREPKKQTRLPLWDGN